MPSSSWTSDANRPVSRKELKRYLVRNNRDGLIHLAIHLAAITASGTLLFFMEFSIWAFLLMCVHGGMIAFLFAPMHECVHSSAFRTRRLNVIVGRFCGLIILRPFLYLKYRHMAHHTYTQHPEDDPDRVAFPRGISEYLAHVSSFNIWRRMLKNLLLQSVGKFTAEESFIPKSELRPVVNEARVMLVSYAFVAVASLYFQSWLAVYLWLLPRVLGEPVLRAFRMIEHTGMAESPNMLENTRTTYSNFLVRFFYWNMPYHAEHHLYPSVPFHALRKLHEEQVKEHLAEIAPGVLVVHYRILKRMLFSKPEAQVS